MINILKTFSLFGILILSDFYLFIPNIRVPLLSMLMLSTYLLLTNGFSRLKGEKLKSILVVMVVGTLFVVYMSALDFLRGDSLYSLFVQLLSSFAIMMMFPAFSIGVDNYDFLKWMRRIAWISLVFALMQVFGLKIILADLVPLIGSDRIGDEGIFDIYNRATGASSNTIAYAILMAFVLLYAYWLFQSSRVPLRELDRTKLSALVIGILAATGLLISQTRAAILGSVIAILIVTVFSSKDKFLALAKAIFVAFTAVIAYLILERFAATMFPYIFKEIDIGDTHRLWVNWYMTIGVLQESPWIGISPDQAWDVYFRHGDMAISSYNPANPAPTPTHHNQPGFYFRYYGVLGILLLTAVYAVMFRLIARSRNRFMAYFLASCLILDFLYSLTHNNKLMGSPLLWAMLSLVFVESQRKQTGVPCRE